MRGILTSRKMYQFVRIILGVVFVASGGIKAADFAAFSRIIDAFAILGPGMSYPAAVLISCLELFLGIGLVADIKGSLGGILGLLLGFVLVLSWALYMGYDVDCGCFGPQDPEAKAFSSLKTSLGRDVGMILSVFYLYIWRFRNRHNPVLLKNFHKKE